ncbi:hypothetical protein GIB67_042569, partial [Kingdonia uniflora]
MAEETLEMEVRNVNSAFRDNSQGNKGILEEKVLQFKSPVKFHMKLGLKDCLLQVKSKSILDPCEDENDDIQEEEDVSLGVDSVQMADPSDSDSEIHSPEEDNYIITPTDNTQNDEEDEQQLARLRDWMELYHTDTVELTDVLSNFPDISMAILGGTIQVPTVTGDVVLKVIRKESLLDTVAQEGTELEAVLKELSISRKKRANSRSEKDQKSQSTRLMTGDDNKKKGTEEERSERIDLKMSFKKWRKGRGLQLAARLMKGICLGVEEENAELKKGKVELEKNIAQLKVDLIKEGKWLEALKASEVVEINMFTEARVNMEKVVTECDRLGRHLISKGYFEDDVNAIMADTYVEVEEDDEAEDVVVRVVDGLDGVSPQTVRDNQGNDNECSEGENEKELKEMHLKIKDLATELDKEKDILASLLSSQAELQVKLEIARLSKDEIRQRNQEFRGEFDKMREANEDKEDQHVKVHFKFVDATQTVVDFAQKIEERDTKINKGQKEPAEMKEHAAKFKSHNDVLMAKTLPAKDMELQTVQRKYDELNERVTQLKTKLMHANLHARIIEAGESSRKNKSNAKVSLVQGDVVSLSARMSELEGILARTQ